MLNRPRRLAVSLLALVATFLLLAPAAGVAAPMSWTPLRAAWSLGDPEMCWPNVVWHEGVGGIWLGNLETGAETPLSETIWASPPMCTEDIVVWTEQPTSASQHAYARFLGSGVTTEIPLAYGSALESDASGMRIARFVGHVKVYDCETETETVITRRLGSTGTGAIDGDRVAWVWRPDGNESTTTIHVYDLSTGVESVVATCANRIGAVDIDGERLVYSAAKDPGMQPALYLVDLSTGEERMLCRTPGWPYPLGCQSLALQGHYAAFTGLGLQLVDIDTGSVFTAGAFSDYTSWSFSGTHIVASDSLRLSLGTLETVEATHTLTYTAGSGGTIVGPSPQIIGGGASATTVTAVADTGRHFVSWSDGGTSAARVDTTISADASFTAVFAVNTYALTYTSEPNGTVSGVTSQTVEYGASGSPVTPVAAAGYYWVCWSDGSRDYPRVDGGLTTSLTVQALFSVINPNACLLIYSAGPGGTIRGNCRQTVYRNYATAPVQAIADPGFRFVRWSDGVRYDGRAPESYLFTDKFVAAVFEPDPPGFCTVNYYVSAGGSSNGQHIQTVPIGGSTEPFMVGSKLGYHFVSWSDGVTTTSRTDTNVQRGLSVTALFAPNPPPPASVYTPRAPSTMSHSKYYTIYGYLKPWHASGSYPIRIYKYRYVSGHWKSYGYESARATNYSTYTKYSHSIKLPYHGRWRLRAYAPADSGHSATWSSGYDYVTVK